MAYGVLKYLNPNPGSDPYITGILTSARTERIKPMETIYFPITCTLAIAISTRILIQIIKEMRGVEK